MDVLYGTITRSGTAQLGGWLDTLINAGVQAGVGVYAANQQAAQNGPAKGKAAITAFGNQVIQALQQLLTSLRQGQADLSQVKTQAAQLRATLDNSQYVYQAQHGDDAVALADAKSSADALVQQINAQADTFMGGTMPAQTTAPAGGTSATAPVVITQTPTGTLLFGYPAETVLIVAAIAGGGLWFLTR